MFHTVTQVLSLSRPSEVVDGKPTAVTLETLSIITFHALHEALRAAELQLANGEINVLSSDA